MVYLNGILARVGGNLNNNFQKSQMPGGLPGGGMLKLRFDRYIILLISLILFLISPSSFIRTSLDHQYRVYNEFMKSADGWPTQQIRCFYNYDI